MIYISILKYRVVIVRKLIAIGGLQNDKYKKFTRKKG